jgi:hypothetical protein
MALMRSPGPALRPNMAPGSPVTGITSYTCPSSGHHFFTLPWQGYAVNPALSASTNMHPGRPPLQQNSLPQVNAWTSGPTAVPSTYAQTAPLDRSASILPSPAVAPIKPLSVPPKHQETALSSGMAEKASEHRRSGWSGLCLSRRSRITIVPAILLAITVSLAICDTTNDPTFRRKTTRDDGFSPTGWRCWSGDSVRQWSARLRTPIPAATASKKSRLRATTRRCCPTVRP